MKSIKYYILLFIALLFTGCTAKMTVEMKILNRNFLLNSPNYWLEKLKPLENKIRYNLLSGEYENLRKKAKKESRESIQKIITKLNQARANKINQQVQNTNPHALRKKNITDSITIINNRPRVRMSAAENRKLTQDLQRLTTELQSLEKQEAGFIAKNRQALASDAIIQDEDAESLVEAIDNLINQQIDSIKKVHLLALQKSDNAKSWYPCDSSGKGKNPCEKMMLIIDNLRGSYALATNGFVQLNGLGAYLASEIKKLNDSVSTRRNNNIRSMLTDYSDPNVSDILEELASDVNKTTRPLTNTDILKSIQNDPLASIVAGADKNQWKAITNKALGRTWIGNSDIAFVTQPNGEYTIKGVRNDASNATMATFQFLNFTVEALAKFSGVTMPTNTEGDTLATTSGVLIQANSDLKILKVNSQSAKIRIFQAILDQQANLNDSLKRQSAINNIRTIFEASKKTLLNE